MRKKKLYTLKEVLQKFQDLNPGTEARHKMDYHVAKELGLLTVSGTPEQLALLIQLFREYSVLVTEQKLLYSLYDDLYNAMYESTEDDDEDDDDKPVGQA